MYKENYSFIDLQKNSNKLSVACAMYNCSCTPNNNNKKY